MDEEVIAEEGPPPHWKDPTRLRAVWSRASKSAMGQRLGGDGIASHGHPGTAKNNWNSICWNYSVPGPVISIGQTDNLINK